MTRKERTDLVDAAYAIYEKKLLEPSEKKEDSEKEFKKLARKVLKKPRYQDKAPRPAILARRVYEVVSEREEREWNRFIFSVCPDGYLGDGVYVGGEPRILP